MTRLTYSLIWEAILLQYILHNTEYDHNFSFISTLILHVFINKLYYYKHPTFTFECESVLKIQ